MRLSESTIKKSENLALMRFFASIFVILGHSYAISGSPLKYDFVYRGTGEIISLGGICVSLFFICSGYLITRSMGRVDKFLPYIKARLKRLVPPLAFVVVLTVIAGIFLTTVSVKEYFTSSKTYVYLLNAVMLTNQYLPGVFENNVFGPSVNGALWTLPVELACYVACYIFYKTKLLNPKRFYFTAPIVVLALVFEGYIPSVFGDMVRPCAFFYVGMLYYVYREKIVLNVKLLPVVILALVGAFFVKPLIIPALIVLWPYALFTIWFALPQCPKLLGKTGDISYGIYLWGFFVQQTLVFLWGGSMPQIINFCLSAVISIVLGTVTFLITEKPLQKKK
ncbi:MAG: acyltransferase [Clostridia bacterium]|nr:acyltransferase [Clostridia bacterium]